MFQDIRHSLRSLRKTPVFTTVALASLALGIGANTAIFTLMDQVLLRSLPVEHPRELVIFNAPGPNRGSMMGPNTFSYPMYRDFRDRNEVFTGVIAYYSSSASISYRGQTERGSLTLVTGNYFDVLGVKTVLGRPFTPADDRNPGAHPLAVLSYNCWQRRFGGDPTILNQTIDVNDHALTVVGIAAPGFSGLSAGAAIDVMVPMMMKAAMTPGWDDLENRRILWLYVMGRLKPGIARAQAEVAMNTLWRPILAAELKDIPDATQLFRTRFLNKHLTLAPGSKGRSQLRDSFSAPLLVLMSMVGLVLLIACANVANLLIARGAAREREIAIRLALGASRRRIGGQLLTESLLLALGGGAMGLLAASWAGNVLIRLFPSEGGSLSLSTAPDARVLAFTLGISLLTGILFGLIPAIQCTRPAVAGTLKDQAASVSAGTSHVRFRKTLVIAQVALSLLLLIGCGLFARSLYNLKNLRPGYRVDHLMTFAIDASLNGYSTPRLISFYQMLQDNLSGLAGVGNVSMAEGGLLRGADSSMTVAVEGYRAKESENMNPNWDWVGPRYFATAGIPLIAGREFTNRDGAQAAKVVIINETMALRYFGNESPIGRRISTGGGGLKPKAFYEIVGVVKDSHSLELRGEVPRFVYAPYQQDENPGEIAFYLRTMADPAAFANSIRAQVRNLDANIPVFGLRTMSEQLDASLYTDRMIALLSACFGLLATLLAAIGLYGVMAYQVSRRTREIGIRMALGAERGSVLWLILRETAILATAGVAIALPVSLGLSRLVAAQLYGISSGDPVVMAAAAILLALVAMLAGYLPARRATRVDPLVALRYE